MNQEAIKELVQSFTNAGWDIDDSFSGYLIIGFSGDNLSIVAHEGEEEVARETDEHAFELLDHHRNVTYWVKEVPTPSRPNSCLRSTESYPRCERIDLRT